MMPQQRAKRQRDITTLNEFYMMAKDVQRRSGQKINAANTEDRRFREFFSVGVHVAIITWTLLLQHGLLPKEATVPHFLYGGSTSSAATPSKKKAVPQLLARKE
jgi:hypothetical protein